MAKGGDEFYQVFGAGVVGLIDGDLCVVGGDRVCDRGTDLSVVAAYDSGHWTIELIGFRGVGHGLVLLIGVIDSDVNDRCIRFIS